MAVAFQSVGTLASHNTGNSRVIPKPTGLAVGELMVASVGSVLNGGTAVDLLSGWTNVYYSGDTTTSGVSHRVMYKVADSGDVAASDFTFNCTGTNPVAGGAIWRISGSGVSTIIDVSSGASWSGTSASLTGVTPTRASDLYLILVTGRSSDGDHSDADISTYAIATSNPSWTQAYDLANTDDDTLQIAGAYAIRPEVTATGNFSFNSVENFNSGNAVLVAVANSLDVTVSPSVIQVTASVQTPTPAGGATVTVAAPAIATASVQTPIRNDQAVWSNAEKHTTSWTNQSKS